MHMIYYLVQLYEQSNAQFGDGEPPIYHELVLP